MLEYNGHEAMILASNTTRKRIKNVKKLLRIGTQDYMQVTHSDQDGGYVDLSKRTVQLKDVEEKKKFFDKSKMVHLIMKLTAYNLKVPLLQLYEEFGWDLYDNFEHAYDALKLSLTDPDIVFSKINIKPEHKEALILNINKKMAATPIKLRSRFNLQCYTYEGIEAIREALLETKKKTADEQFKLIFQLVSTPEYKCECVTLDKNGGSEKIEKAVEIVKEEVKKRGGIFELICGPTRIGSKGDGFDADEIRANLEDKEYSEGQESNEEGIDIDLGDDIQAGHDNDDEEEKVAS